MGCKICGNSIVVHGKLCKKLEKLENEILNLKQNQKLLLILISYLIRGNNNENKYSTYINSYNG